MADPTSYGVVDFDENGSALSLKKNRPLVKLRVQDFISTTNSFRFFARSSALARGELEIPTLTTTKRRSPRRVLGRGTAWLDTRA